MRFAGLTHVRTSPYYPHSNGKLERFHGTLKDEWFRPSCPETIEEANRKVQRFVQHYNHVRLHSAIGYVTPAVLTGVDLTQRAIGHTQRRFELLGLKSSLQVADAEALPFADNTFDAVYSWGVLHHSPNTEKAVSEVWRVLKPGGFAKIMIYHKYALVGYMLWIRYALLRGKPWMSLDTIYDRYLESPGTKAYSVKQARQLFRDFDAKTMSTHMSHGDLLASDAGQRHRGPLLQVAKAIWPRSLLDLLIEVEKPEA